MVVFFVVVVAVVVAVFVVDVLVFVVFAMNKYSGWVREMSLVISIVKLLTIESALDEKHRKEGGGCKCVNSNKKNQENKNYFFSHHNMLPLTMISYILSPFPRKGKQKF